MNREEATTILAMVAAYQPGQKMVGELTDKAWAHALSPYHYLDAQDAVNKLAVAPRRPGEPFWMELRDIISEINTVRRRRYDARAHQLPEPPVETRDNPEAYVAWLRSTSEAACERDWRPVAELDQPQRPIHSLVKQIGVIRSGAHPTGGQS